MRYAGFWVRFWALIVDELILMPLWIVPLFLMSLWMGQALLEVVTLQTVSVAPFTTLLILPIAGFVIQLLYFAFFVLMPWYSARDKTKPVPERVTG